MITLDGLTATDWSIHGIRVSKENEYGLLPIEIEAGKPVYVVYAIWSSGDSFGHDENSNCEAQGVFATRDDADAYIARLNKGKGSNDYLPRNGYFESLTEISIVSGIV